MFQWISWEAKTWRFSLGLLKAENMIKGPKNGQEGVQGEVRAKALLVVLRIRFAKNGIQNFFKLELDCVPVDFLPNQSFDDLV